MGKWGAYAQKTSQGGGGGGGLFLKVENGSPAEFIVPPTAKPYQRYRRWLAAEGKYQDADGPGEGVQCRILLPVFAVAANEMKVLEMAPSTFADLCTCLDHAKIGGTDQVYEISRTGTGKDTRWKIQRIDRADADRLAHVARQSLLDLGKFGDPVPMGETTPPPKKQRTDPMPAQREPGDEQPDAQTDDDIPF